MHLRIPIGTVLSGDYLHCRQNLIGPNSGGSSQSEWGINFPKSRPFDTVVMLMRLSLEHMVPLFCWGIFIRFFHIKIDKFSEIRYQVLNQECSRSFLFLLQQILIILT